MITHLRTFSFIALLAVVVVLAPALTFAQVPPPAVAGSHPNVTPPTKAPTEPLPVTPLPNGSMTAPTVPTAAAGESARPGTEWFSGNAVLYVLIGLGILFLAGIRYFLNSRRNIAAVEVAEKTIEEQEVF
ncbi:MAG: hypothetical protein WC217_00395 [Candidatus Paceibacterota bacterium]|jgi:hypothetical protein